jgi:hypothetical protein
VKAAEFNVNTLEFQWRSKVDNSLMLLLQLWSSRVSPSLYILGHPLFYLSLLALSDQIAVTAKQKTQRNN